MNGAGWLAVALVVLLLLAYFLGHAVGYDHGRKDTVREMQDEWLALTDADPLELDDL